VINQISPTQNCIYGRHTCTYTHL